MSTIRVAKAVVARPRLWPTAVRQAVILVPSRWWRRWPFLPLPPAAYVRFRAHTQYGDAGAAPQDDDVTRYLEWCRDMRRPDGR